MKGKLVIKEKKKEEEKDEGTIISRGWQFIERGNNFEWVGPIKWKMKKMDIESYTLFLNLLRNSILKSDEKIFLILDPPFTLLF